MTFIKENKWAIAVSESGLHMVVDDILTAREAHAMLTDIRNALHEYKKLTKKHIDEGNLK